MNASTLRRSLWLSLRTRGTSTNESVRSSEAEQLPQNRYVTVRNPRAGEAGNRRLLSGRTDGGRSLTLVIERTVDPTTWLIVTGWSSTEAERKILEARQ